MKSSTIAKISYVTLLSLGNSLLNFVFQLVIAKTFGAGTTTDAFFLAFSIPEWIMNITLFIVPVAVIPSLSGYVAKGEEEKAWRLTNGLITLTVVVFGIICAGLLIFNRPISTLVAGNLDREGIEVFYSVSFFLVPVILITTLSSILTALYYAFDRYFLPNMSPLIQTAVMIGGVIIFKHTLGIRSAALFILIGNAVRLAILVLFFKKRRLGLTKHVLNDEVKAILVLIVPLLIGNLILKSGVFVDRFFASFLAAGSVTYIFYASRVTRLLARLTSKGTYTVFFPQLSKAAAREDKGEFQTKIDDSMRLVMFIGFLVVGGVLLFASNILYVLFENRNFSTEDVIKTAIATKAMAGLLFAAPIGDIMNNIYYSVKDTRTPMIISVIVFIVAVGLKLIMLKAWGYIGIAVGSSIEAVAVILIGLILLKRKLENIRLRTFLKSLGQNLIAFICAGGAVFAMVWILFSARPIFIGPKLSEFGVIFGLWLVFALIYLLINRGLKNHIAVSLLRAVKIK